MTNKVIIALNEFCKKGNPPSGEVAEKHGITKTELMAKAPR